MKVPEGEDARQYEPVHDDSEEYSNTEHSEIKWVERDSQQRDAEELHHLRQRSSSKDQRSLHSPISKHADASFVEAEKKVETKRNHDVRKVAVVQTEESALEIRSNSDHVDQSYGQQDANNDHSSARHAGY